MPHQHDLEQDAHAVVRVEITSAPSDPIGTCLRGLADPHGSSDATTHDPTSRERTLVDLTTLFLENVAEAGLQRTAGDRVPESTRVEVVVDPAFPVVTVIEVAQHLVAALDHGIWLTYGPHRGTLHLCPRFIALCV